MRRHFNRQHLRVNNQGLDFKTRSLEINSLIKRSLTSDARARDHVFSTGLYIYILYNIYDNNIEVMNACINISVFDTESSVM